MTKPTANCSIELQMLATSLSVIIDFSVNWLFYSEFLRTHTISGCKCSSTTEYSAEVLEFMEASVTECELELS